MFIADERKREELRERPGERRREKSRKRRKQWSGVEGGGGDVGVTEAARRPTVEPRSEKERRSWDCFARR